MGKFEQASGGSIFLDEINSLPLTVQPKLLRVLQEREVDRIGGTELIPIDTRFIAATNSSLAAKVKAHEFREDLYYRLNVVSIRIPPLRERKSDIPLLARSFMSKLNYEMGLEFSYIDRDAMALLMRYDWPGNIRELQNVIELAMNHAHGDTIEARHIEPYFQRGKGAGEDAAPAAVPETQGFRGTQARMERELITEALEACGGNCQRAAERLGIPRSTFYRKLKKYGL